MPQTAEKHPQCAQLIAALPQCQKDRGATRWGACVGANQALAKCLAEEQARSTQAAKAAAVQQAAAAAAAVGGLLERHERAELEADCFTIFHA